MKQKRVRNERHGGVKAARRGELDTADASTPTNGASAAAKAAATGGVQEATE